MRNLLLISAIAAIPLGLGALDLLKVGASEAAKEVVDVNEPYVFPDLFGDGSSIDVNGVPFPVPEDWEGCVFVIFDKSVWEGRGFKMGKYSPPLTAQDRRSINKNILSGEGKVSNCHNTAT